MDEEISTWDSQALENWQIEKPGNGACLLLEITLTLWVLWLRFPSGEDTWRQASHLSTQEGLPWVEIPLRKWGELLNKLWAASEFDLDFKSKDIHFGHLGLPEQNSPDKWQVTSQKLNVSFSKISKIQTLAKTLTLTCWRPSSMFLYILCEEVGGTWGCSYCSICLYINTHTHTLVTALLL